MATPRIRVQDPDRALDLVSIFRQNERRSASATFDDGLHPDGETEDGIVYRHHHLFEEDQRFV